ncbi:hypothetical protein HaLaN_18371 [Haematococcus lacustris]|uniref:Uncharacterized protein n=2 Tax=Haematococcus lacustris TaxID=44745 RepID=A0A699ZJ62_HAELA|nr:hypothetical protein HaLaN_18371 [Haematococcus lacustris]
MAYFSMSNAIRKGGTGQAIDTQGSAQGYDVVMFSSFMMGDIATSGALVDLAPYISNDTDQVVAWSDYPPYYTASSRFKDQVRLQLIVHTLT